MTPAEIQADAADHAATMARVREASGRCVAADAITPKPLPPATTNLSREPSHFSTREEEAAERTACRNFSRMRRAMLSSYRPPRREIQ